MTNEFEQLLQTDVGLRDSAWEERFFSHLLERNLKLLFQQPQTGPDGFAYLLAETVEQGGEPALKILTWLTTRGIGLVINPRKTYPDYVFTFGMLWNFRERGEFLTTSAPAPAGSVTLKPGQPIWVAEPTPEFLPEDVRGLIRQFLLDQGVLRPRVNLISTDQKQYDVAFALESLGNPKESEHMGIAEAIGWFLPAHYSVVLISEKMVPGFTDL